ncbi:MAG: ATP-binding cassette domain-containing protein [Nitrospirae bacterium]|nr:MAG: ATP-binding cassette domain-containing protein [Nitrospirota bacterium]
MVQVSGLCKAYGDQVLFDRASFVINKGERVGLVGRNGHGKTTLFRMMLGDEQPDSGVISFSAGYTKGHLSQHISFTEKSVLDEACLSIPESDDGTDQSFRAKAILAGLGFAPEDIERNPSELSGGFQIRLNLAKLLLQGPDLLLLDEPTNYLDIVSVRWLAAFLRSWKKELMLITHDRDFMDGVTTHTMGIHRLKIKKVAGSTIKFYEQSSMEDEMHEKGRMNDERRRAEIEQFINRFRAKATKAKAVQSRIKALSRSGRIEKLQDEDTLDFSFRSAPFTGKSLVEMQNIRFSFSDSGGPLIKGLGFVVGKNDRIGVIGKNGKGKTTLLNLMAGELMPQEGRIIRHNQLKQAYFGQTNINRLELKNTVEEEVLAVLPEHNRSFARGICGLMMFSGDRALKKIGVLSGGERSRVLLGKILAAPANLLLLDEPTNHLDMESIESLLEAIRAFEGAVVIVTHSELILREVANRLIVFDDNRIRVFEGGYEDFLNRVGWKDEGPVEGDAINREQPSGKKDMRRMRAEIINKRSKALMPLQKRIEEIENTIMLLEKGLDENTTALLKVSEKGDWQASADLSRDISGAKARIDGLFAELQILSEELESKSKEFAGMLDGFAVKQNG